MASSPKYTQPLLDTPQTITVIPAAIIREQGATTLRDVLRNSPGITFQAGEGGGGLPGDQNFSMRGFSSRNSLFIDGVRDIGAYTRDSFNLQQVEVIKGPTGSMAGRSATSGAINQVTKTPQARDAQDYSLGYGSDDYKRVTARHQLGLSDSMALRVNAMYHDAEVSNRDVVENKRWGIAPSFALGLGEATRFTLSYLYLDEDNVPDYGLPWGTTTQTTATDPSHNGTFPTGAYDAHAAGRPEQLLWPAETTTSKTSKAKSRPRRSSTTSATRSRCAMSLRYVDSERASAITAPRPPNRQLQRRTMGTENVTNLTDVTWRFATGSRRARTRDRPRAGARDHRQPQQRADHESAADSGLLSPGSESRAARTRCRRTSAIPARLAATPSLSMPSDTVALSEQWQVAAGVRCDTADIDFTVAQLHRRAR